MSVRTITFALVVAIALASSSGANADVRMCLKIEADMDAKSFSKLVNSEVARHPTHKVVNDNCETSLVVELFKMASTRYLTVRIEGEVPMRYTIASDGQIVSKLSEGITRVLKNDPVYLAKDITRYSKAKRAAHDVTVRGTNYWRFEFFQGLTRTGQGVAMTPGGAFSAARGSGHWQISLRIFGAGWFEHPTEDKPTLRVLAGVDAGITYEFMKKTAVSPYITTGAGLGFLRFEGILEDGQKDNINQFGPQLFTRLGIRMFRYYDFDADLFITGYLPCFVTNEIDSLLFGDKGRYTPGAQVGFGIGF